MLAARVAAELRERGFAVLRGAFAQRQLDDMEVEYARLSRHARDILLSVRRAGISFSEYYERHQTQLIAVPERDDPRQLCRFEYIVGSSAHFRDDTSASLRRIMEDALGREFALFKDKCNLKMPGGGEFGAHQDIPAYADFGPDIYLTAAVFLDEATRENGALEFATNYRKVGGGKAVATELGLLPLFETESGGERSGEIAATTARELQWDLVRCDPGDAVLFDAYVPHRSQVNRSSRNRRALFFTYNFRSAGDLYETYYREKRRNFAHPRFHVATPTLRN